jgi:hypothetical protein
MNIPPTTPCFRAGIPVEPVKIQPIQDESRGADCLEGLAAVNQVANVDSGGKWNKALR